MFTTELQYVIIRYMLNELADEAANVGIIAVTDDPPRIYSRFLDDPNMKSRNDIKVKKEVVDRFASFVLAQQSRYESNAPSADPYTKTFFAPLREFGSGLIRTNLPRSVLTNDVEQEVKVLFDQWVSPITPPPRHRPYAPKDPLRTLRRKASSALIREFRKGYGPLSRKVVLQHYDVQGASHNNKIDLVVLTETKKKTREHLYQHLLLLPDAEETFTQAAALCWRWSDINEANHFDRQLTAVLYGRPDRPARGLPDSSRLLKKENIAIVKIGELSQLAQQLKTHQGF